MVGMRVEGVEFLRNLGVCRGRGDKKAHHCWNCRSCGAGAGCGHDIFSLARFLMVEGGVFGLFEGLVLVVGGAVWLAWEIQMGGRSCWGAAIWL